MIVFAGGTGTSSFARHLARRVEDLTFLVNAYDDGYSTGEIRRAFDILGPSDMGKLLVTLSATAHTAVARWLSARTPVDTSLETFSQQARALLDTHGVPAGARSWLMPPLETFVELARAHRGSFSVGDLAMRNAVLVGARARHDGSYQRALDHLGDRLGLSARIVLVNEEQLRLGSVLEDGRTLSNEWEICVPMTRAPVERVFLTSGAAVGGRPFGDGDAGFNAGSVLDTADWPKPTAAARDSLEKADVMVWAPGTLYSSLVPTAAIVGPMLRATAISRRLLVSNLRQEQEATTVHRTVVALARAIHSWRDDPLPVSAGDVADTVLCDRQQRAGGGYAWGDVIPADHEALTARCRVRYHGLETTPGVHDGPALVDEIMRAIDA